MVGTRSALIVASYAYDDPGLRKLRAPARDAEALADVLGEPGIGGFEVQKVLNAPAHQVALAIEQFFTDRDTEDVLLLHFSGHGVKDESGDLYFAAADTKLTFLAATAVSADFVNRLMNRTRARRVVLFLDCCYAGAFERGLSTRGDTGLQLGERLGGRGRAVITASTAMEYAFEGNELADSTAGQPSVFTSALVSGLASGDADTDQDGMIGLDELYEYVYEKVRDVTPNQTPSKWALGIQGELYVARRSRPVTTPSELPDDLDEAIDSSFVGVRAGAVNELARLLRGRHAGLALAGRLALERLSSDDSRSVAAAAKAALATMPDSGRTSVPAARTNTDVVEDRERDTPDVVEDRVHDTSDGVQDRERDTSDDGRTSIDSGARARTPPDGSASRADEASLPHRFRLSRRAALLGVGGAAVLAIVVAAVLMNQGGGGGPSSPTGGSVALTNDQIVVPRDTADGSRLFVVDTASSDQATPTQINTSTQAFGAVISPDRSTLVYMTLDPATGKRTARLIGVDGSNDRSLFDDRSPCKDSGRPAFNADGTQLVVVCSPASGPTKLSIADLNGNILRSLRTDEPPADGTTWAQLGGTEVVVYVTREDGRGRLWAIDPAQPGKSEPLTGPTGSDSNPDSSGDSVLFLRSPDGGSDVPGRAMVLTETGVRAVTGPGILDPTWSPDGDEIVYVKDGRLKLRHQDGSVSDLGQGVIGPPAWGTR
jgi:hypothetical protein